MTLPLNTRVRYRGHGPARNLTGTVVPLVGFFPGYSLVMMDHTGVRIKYADTLLTILGPDDLPSEGPKREPIPATPGVPVRTHSRGGRGESRGTR